MKVVLNVLIVFIALHSCSAFNPIFDYFVDLCPNQNGQIFAVFNECKTVFLKELESDEINTEDLLNENYKK